MSNTALRKLIPNDLRESLLGSLGVHIAVIIIFTVKTVFFPSVDMTYQSAVKVDIIALPDKIDLDKLPPPVELKEPEAKAPPVTPEKKAETKEPDTISLKKKNAKMKALEALEKIKQEEEKEKLTSAASQKKEGTFKYKGNILSPGTELTGLNKLQHEQYIVNLDRHIKQHWTLPEWLAKKDYRAQVRVKIDNRGLIISKQLVKSSGNSSYDDIVMTTIDKASPFPPPPDKFTAIVSINGILIGFPE